MTKDRYQVTLAGRKTEVGVFADGLQGLIVTDFEFATAKEKTAFIAPSDPVLTDITQEDFIADGLLAGKTYDDITPDIARFGYRKI